ncbi:MAG: 50S ribosomal protein L10 [Oscillospiraceae bacterium]|jgi:large subunit ribosomal protein L10|nr:50S ribosomal protein L10 [Oscillospiraceae bacterium]
MPNARTLEEKKEAVARLAQSMRQAQSGVLVDYKGINVASDTELRRKLRAAGVEYKVVKNTLMRLAVRQCGFEALESALAGTTAMAVSHSDLTAPARILNEYALRSGGKFSVKAGFAEGRVISASEVAWLADLPPREQLIARALAGFNAPVTGFVSVLGSLMRGLVVALDAVREKKAATTV